jgi:hypothetical protein
MGNVSSLPPPNSNSSTASRLFHAMFPGSRRLSSASRSDSYSIVRSWVVQRFRLLPRDRSLFRLRYRTMERRGRGFLALSLGQVRRGAP